MIKNILIINGHPRKDSFSYALAAAYKKGAEQSGAQIKLINISELNFDAFNTVFQEFEPVEDIKKVQELMVWADHWVWFYPTWWYTVPAYLKAFMEQSLLSGFAFKYLKSKRVVKWDKYLIGRTARIVSTMDAPPWYYRIFNKNPGLKTMKSALGFCGIKPVKASYFGSVKLSTETQRKAWIEKVEELGKKQK